MNFKDIYIRDMKGYICFKHWVRKKYALSDNPKRIVKVCVLCILIVTYTILIQSRIAGAQTDTVRINKKIDLDEIEVIGQRSPALYSEISRIVTVITREQIQSAPVHSIQELLEYITGVDVRQRGMFGIQADINIRASSFDQVLILLNGINISDPHTGHFSMNLPLDAESVERIEILSDISLYAILVLVERPTNCVAETPIGTSGRNHCTSMKAISEVPSSR